MAFIQERPSKALSLLHLLLLHTSTPGCKRLSQLVGRLALLVEIARVETKAYMLQ